MKGPSAVIACLNRQMIGERKSINQYILNARLLTEWGYTKLAKYYEDLAKDEEDHLEKLLSRCFRLSGDPVDEMNVALDTIVPETATELFEKTRSLEAEGIDGYNEGIEEAVKASDNKTKTLFEEILSDEEEHMQHTETALARIEDLGYDNYMQGWL